MATLSAGSDFRSLSRQPPNDPDIQTTLSDFLTYTEHFPSQLTRALTLIEKQRLRAEAKVKAVHDGTTVYSLRPTLAEKPDPGKLRRDISYALEEAERACRMALAEAERMDETCQRESKRLHLVTAKLKAQPMPPSRDPTPEQQELTSPNLKRERRVSARADDKPERPSRHLTDKAASKLRGRKIMVPGEVLPPPDPNAPLESVSDWTSPRVSPPLEEPPRSAEKKKTATPRPRSRTPKIPKSDRDKKPPRPRGPRAPGQPGTNAHSAVAGISTSNALLALTPPPDDAVKGSKWLPWMKLTEWEMAKLRKRMKKNAIWVPSQTMVRRELKNLGRGVAGKEAARQAAEDGSGPAFVDEPHEADPTKVVVTGEERETMKEMLGPAPVYGTGEDEDADAELINRGMRLNEAKKLKRARMLEEQAAANAQIVREQGGDAAADKAPAATDGKKRKREATPQTGGGTDGSVLETPDPLSKPGPAPTKKIKLNGPSAGSAHPSTKIPLAPAGPSSSPKAAAAAARNRRAATPSETRTNKPTLILKTGKAVSEEPPNRRASLRRGSDASLPTPGMPSTTTNSGLLTSPLRSGVTAGSDAAPKPRRSKRPAPGILAQTDDGDAKVGVSKRKAAPEKKAAINAQPKTLTTAYALLPPFDPSAPQVDDLGEPIDPNEPRYCLCGDVSWGTMIACDNEGGTIEGQEGVEPCEREWFHLECVGLGELPPRRTKWYCPDCRKKVKVGRETNGLVGRNVGR